MTPILALLIRMVCNIEILSSIIDHYGGFRSSNIIHSCIRRSRLSLMITIQLTYKLEERNINEMMLGVNYSVVA